ncbi:MAG TPA: formimidoylglutamate deiminase [Acidobacteriaceae bacterium]|nr:formimidoylglutamate deiminase [Acidobacteriaceae bacterium]
MEPTVYSPDLIYCDGRFVSGTGLLVDATGKIEKLVPMNAGATAKAVPMPGKALLPGLVNGHSHSFQRLIRGRAETRGASGNNFWTWRDTMYRAAKALDADQVYDVARMTFLEMALAGITAVGEFHYLHKKPDGAAYDDPNELAKKVIAAAKSVGLRICLLRVAYLRAGYKLEPNPGQMRFYETLPEYMENTAALARGIAGQDRVSMGVAPHSVRAVPLDALKEIVQWAEERQLPLHMHAAEQRAENAACGAEYGVTPVQLLARNGLLTERSTLVHAIHITPDERDAIAGAGAMICSCPTTERNLGDGIVDAEAAIAKGIGFCFGSDSQATIDLLEDARELDCHLRLVREQRVILDGVAGVDISQRLLGYATAGGAKSLGLNAGELKPGAHADFFTVDLNDVSIAGAAAGELTGAVVFGMDRAAVRDVVVGGERIVSGGRHGLQEEIVRKYGEVSAKVWR